jgi:hypothetical protein
MWDKVVDTVGQQFPVAILFAAWALTTFVYYRRQQVAYVKSLEKRFEEQTRAVAEANEKLIAELRSQITALKRERAALRKELGKKDDED